MARIYNLNELEAHVKSTFSALQVLINSKHYTHAVYLSYILIDQLAWLISKNEKVVNVYFRSWVEKYFIEFYSEITPMEMWADRNGQLHNNSSISRKNENDQDVRQLWFVYDTKQLGSINDLFKLEKVYVVNGDHFLIKAIPKSVSKFLNDISRDSQLLNDEDFQFKLGKLLGKFEQI